MAEFQKDEFKFPDEVEEKQAKTVEEDDPLDIEVIDDVPEEDRKNATPMPKEIVDELDQDDLEAYSGEAKQKLLQMKKVYNDERRAKESALREQQEALRVAQQLVDENKRLKGRLTTGEQALVSNYKESSERELEIARKNFKEAYDSGDADLLADAQEKLIEAKQRVQKVQEYKPEFTEEALQTPETSVQMPQTQQRLDPKTQAWLDKNPWYGTDDDMSYLAMGVHRRLEREGVALGSDHYFNVIDKEMRQRFPEKFQDEVDAAPEEDAKPSKQSTPRPTVAPATRSTSSKKIRLTQTQLALAKKFNLTPEQYARELLKTQESQNG
jgi:hypothetical protein